MGKMRVLNETGDATVLEWSTDDAAAIREAESVFDQLRAEGRMAFARPAGGLADDVWLIHDFDPNADEIIWKRGVQGGCL